MKLKIGRINNKDMPINLQKVSLITNDVWNSLFAVIKTLIFT